MIVFVATKCTVPFIRNAMAQLQATKAKEVDELKYAFSIFTLVIVALKVSESVRYFAHVVRYR